MFCIIIALLFALCALDMAYASISTYCFIADLFRIITTIINIQIITKNTQVITTGRISAISINLESGKLLEQFEDY